MAERPAQNLIRVLTGTALCAGLMASLAVPIPEKLPAIAIGQASLYRLEVTLLIFYSWLLLITPAFSGLVRGRLPIEITTRGAKFAEETSDSDALNEQRIEELERIAEAHGENLTRIHREIKQMKGINEGDSTQAEVDSKQ